MQRRSGCRHHCSGEGKLKAAAEPKPVHRRDAGRPGSARALSSLLFVIYLLGVAGWGISQTAEVTLVVSVVESTTGAAVPFATILANGQAVAQADSTGRAVVRLSAPRSTVVVAARAIGYSVCSDTVQLNRTDTFRVVLRLRVAPVQARPVAVEARRPVLMHTRTRLRLGTTLLESPQMWSGDLLRVAQLAPGTVLRTDANTRIYLGGGDYYQTAVLWNGLPIFNPSHIGGLISSLAAARQDCVVISGIDPVLGTGPGGTAGSLELWTRPGHSWRLDANPISGLFEWSRAGHSGWLDLRSRIVHYELPARAAHHRLPYSFWDVGGTVVWKGPAGLALSAAGYASHDYLFERFVNTQLQWVSRQASWGNRAWGVTVQLPLRERWTGVARIRGSRTNLATAGSTDPATCELQFAEAGLGAVISMPFWTTRLGAHRVQLRAHHNWSIHDPRLWDILSPPTDVFFDFAPLDWTYRESLTYFTVPAALQVNSGKYGVSAETRIDFHPGRTGPLWSGTVEVHRAGSRTTLSLVCGVHRQYYYAVKQKLNAGLDDPFSAYFITRPADGEVLSSRYVGALVTYNWLGAELGGAAYTKVFSNLPFSDFSSNRVFRVEGRSVGASMWVQLATSWLATGTWVDLMRATMCPDTWVLAPYDRAVQIRATASLRPRRGLRIAVSLYYLSGLAYTRNDHAFWALPSLYRDRNVASREVQLDIVGSELPFSSLERRPVWSRMYGARTPPYWRADVSLEADLFNIMGKQVSGYLRVFNVTNRKNEVGYEWSPGDPGDRAAITGLPFVPMVGIRIQPSDE